MWADRSEGAKASPTLVLASSSPRRAELLAAVGVAPVVAPADIDETPRTGEVSIDLVKRLAVAKAQVVAERAAAVDEGNDGGSVFVLGADTMVTIDEENLGKPVDNDDARRTLTLLSGRTHEVMTGVAVVRGNPDGEQTTHAQVAVTRVEFKPLEADEIEAYLASGEPMGKAGSYAIQGRGGLFVCRIDGTHDNVVGLPLGLVDDVLALHGHRLRDFSQ